MVKAIKHTSTTKAQDLPCLTTIQKEMRTLFSKYKQYLNRTFLATSKQ